ncbi:expressed unknown protein [Seminavis robusta]|uniref:Methyltransferase domain-containing protein n=1 Tax=Seminavis robusta TaxID=568900 RepID=A0A9N8ELT6_9STRA|nr:expressed unknown protein [Seminavis robusta]|eukprot:Sro1143_g245910.1 n/a (400) ;mRNA; f:4846-6045
MTTIRPTKDGFTNGNHQKKSTPLPSSSPFSASTAGKSRIAVVVVGLVTYFVGRSVEHFSQPVAVEKPAITVVPTITAAAIVKKKHPSNNNDTVTTEQCNIKLATLEHSWNQRRDARRAKTMGNAKPLKHKQKTDSAGAFDYFEPEAVCFDDERFGTSDAEGDFKRYHAYGDGPKFLCGVDRLIEQAQQNNNNNNDNNCLIYNVGSNNQIEFEKASSLILGCEIHTFDPTIKTEDYLGHNYSKFHEWGLGEDGKEVELNHARGKFQFEEMSLETIVQKLGHGNRAIDVFKIDCEGCEYSVIKDIFTAIFKHKLRINQVLVEFHATGMRRRRERTDNDRSHYVDSKPDFLNLRDIMLVADKADMRVFHKERNGWACKGYVCIEYAFVSTDFLRRANAHYIC